MKNIFAISTVSLLVTLAPVAPASAQMTRQGCIDAGGTWTQTFGVFGKCVIAIKASGSGVTPKIVARSSGTEGDPKNITAERCKELGGEMSDGKCVIMTKNMAVTPPPPKL